MLNPAAVYAVYVEVALMETLLQYRLQYLVPEPQAVSTQDVV
jgi:hypothetical protein